MNEDTPDYASIFQASISMAHRAILAKLAAAAAKVDAEYAFLVLLSSGISQISGEGYEEVKHGSISAKVELAAFHLYPRFGESGSRDGDDIQAVFEAIEELQNLRGLDASAEIDRSDPDLWALQLHVTLHAETVRGDSYGHQVRRKIAEIQGRFDHWFQIRTGISPTRALEVIAAFERAANKNLTDHHQKFEDFRSRMLDLGMELVGHDLESLSASLERRRDTLGTELQSLLDEVPLAVATTFEQIVAQAPDFTRAEWTALQSLIGLTPATRASLADARDVQYRPLYFLSDDRFVFNDGTTVCDALFYAFDQATRATDATTGAFRDRKYVPHLASWLEEEAARILTSIFPEHAVYRNLTYPDPEHPGGETELDIAVKWGPFLILCEAKARQYQLKARFGDPVRLRADLKANIEDAFTQTTRATAYLHSQETVTFKEKGTRRKLTLNQKEIRRIYPLSVTLHHFGGLATQLALLKCIRLFPGATYPWSVSYADLEVIAQFAVTPDVLLHYIQRRLDLQHSEEDISGDELDLFGHYLDSRLHPSCYWERHTDENEKFDHLHIAGGSERFDTWFLAKEGLSEERPDIRLAVPPRVLSILHGLRRIGDDGAKWIAFALLDFSPAAIDHLDANLARLEAQAATSDRLLRMTFKDGDVALTVLMTNRRPRSELQRQASFRLLIEKYRRRASASMVIAIDIADTTHSIDSAYWLEGPWERDPVIEEMLAQDPSGPLPHQQMPGRNDPCFCGSGQKFKKCCLSRIERAQNKQ